MKTVLSIAQTVNNRMEEISIVIIKIPVGLLDVFSNARYNIDFVEAMVELAEHAGLDEEAIWNSEIGFNAIVESNGYIRVDHDILQPLNIRVIAIAILSVRSLAVYCRGIRQCLLAK